MKKFILFSFIAVLGLSQTAWADSFLPSTQYARGEKFLPAPIDTASQRFAADWLMYTWGKTQRNKSRATDAKSDNNTSAMQLCKSFTPAFGYTLSINKTPKIYALINKVRNDIMSATTSAKAAYMRKRPFDQFNETSLISTSEASLKKTGSYPSEHAALGWGVSLILAEINIARQDSILSRGYQCGQSQVILGFHYQSDVEAGRCVGTAAVARLHADENFAAELNAAKKEYEDLVTGVNAPAYTPQSTGQRYDLQGNEIDQSPQNGIYIQDGKKYKEK